METKISLEFLQQATNAATEMLQNKYANTCCVSSTMTCTVFDCGDGTVIVSQGNLHDKVENNRCIEFDLRYNHGAVIINSQRIY